MQWTTKFRCLGVLRRLVRANKAALSLARQRHVALVGGKVDEVQVRHIRSTNARMRAPNLCVRVNMRACGSGY